MMFVKTPHIRCALIHCRFNPDRNLPWLTSTQRPNRDVEKPVESIAKLFSTVRNGRLLSMINCTRYWRNSGFSKPRRIEAVDGTLEINPCLCADLKSDFARRADIPQ